MTSTTADDRTDDDAFDDDRDRRLPDAELIARLRLGDAAAYEELWTRHVAVALRVARRLAPNDADDIVADAFIAVHQQIAERGAGPDDNFRAYLLATVRNNAAKLHRDAARLPVDEEGEPVDELDGLTLVEDEDSARTLLGAFNALPDRWQRVLWLAEVERVKRPTIAAHLGLRPNAVSVLHRRAKDGLRVEWLKRQIPEPLLGDPGHCASGIPAVIVGTAGTRDGARVLEHLATCPPCSEVERDLRAVYGGVPDIALSTIGFAALGITLPAAATVWSVPVGAAAAATVGIAIVSSAAAVLGLVAGDITGIGRAEAAVQATTPATIIPSPGGSAPGSTPPPSPAADAIGLGTAADARVSPAADPVSPSAIPTEVLFDPSAPERYLIPPERPDPVDPSTVPGPAEQGGTPSGSNPDDGNAPEATPEPSRPPLASPSYAVARPSSTQLAPTMSGTTAAPGEQVAIRVDDALYTVAPDSTGAWAFDLRPLLLSAGQHTATVWSFSSDRSSTPSTETFSIDPVEATGIGSYTTMSLSSSMAQGTFLTLTGLPGSTICMASSSGQAVDIVLDAAGRAERIVRFLRQGYYQVVIAACDGDFLGPATGGIVQVTDDSVSSPWILPFPEQYMYVEEPEPTS